MSIKAKQAILRCLYKIKSDTFDEDTIRTLLFVSREYFKSDGLTREFAHFIAHTERSQGVFHRKINSRYVKDKLINEQYSKIDSTVRNSITTEDELSDYLLSGVSVDKIEAKLYNILYVDGLDDIPESHLIKYTGFDKNEVKELFDRFYIKKGGYYYITTGKSEFLASAIRRLPISKYNPLIETEMEDTINRSINISNEIKRTIDRIQRVIRGVIYFNSVFDIHNFRSEIVSEFTLVLDRFGIEKEFINDIINHNDDILLCIMTLLHDSKFSFYDKEKARIFLCFHLDHDIESANKPKYDIRDDMHDRGVIALYVTVKSITFPLFTSDLPIKKYIIYESYITNPSRMNLSETVWTSAIRIDGTLQLTKYI